MRLRKYIAHFLLLGYLGSCILSHLGYIQWNHTEAAEKNTQVTQLIALLVDKKIYNDLQGDIERYATKYLQKHYPLSKAMVLQIDTKEYTAPELVKLLENIYFDGIKNKNSRLIGTILIGDIPLPVVKYNDYIFPSIYPYVDFLEQKYLRSESEKYFIKNHDG